MAAKKTRLEVLRYLLANKHFDNQDEILKDLQSQGFKVAQPTLSRDLHALSSRSDTSVSASKRLKPP